MWIRGERGKTISRSWQERQQLQTLWLIETVSKVEAGCSVPLKPHLLLNGRDAMTPLCVR